MDRMIDIFLDSFWPILSAGLKMTIPLSVISFAIGTVIAIFVAIIRIRKVKILKPIADFYVWIVRGTPLLVQLFIIFFGFPRLGWTIPAFPAAVLGFSISIGAYSSEIIRSAILSVPKGQWEAAKSLNLTYNQTIRKIILPQATKVAIPPLFNDFISTVKNTSLASSITVTEMMLVSQRIAARTFEPFLLYLEVALIYLIFSTILSYIQDKIEQKLNLTSSEE